MRNYSDNKYIRWPHTLELIEEGIYRVLLSPVYKYGSFVKYYAKSDRLELA